MLSRVADALFWMSRYVERAEQIARLLEINFHLELDLHGVGAGSHDLQWHSLLKILQQSVTPKAGEPIAAAVCAALTFDTANGGSMMTCVNRSRNNARSIRGSLSTDVWRELNKLYWQLADVEFRTRSLDSPHELYQVVQTGSQMFQGVCDATLTHDEGWRFIQLGKYLERADKTLRILECNYDLLGTLDESTDLLLLNLHWSSVLKSCQAYQAYQRIYISRVEPDRVLEFLLFNPDFPNSVRFCLREAADHLDAIGGGDASEPGGKAARILRRAGADLEYLEPEEILHNGLKGFLHTTWLRCADAGAAVREQYSLI